VRGGKQTPVCSRTVHSSTVATHLRKLLPNQKYSFTHFDFLPAKSEIIFERN